MFPHALKRNATTKMIMEIGRFHMILNQINIAGFNPDD